MPNKFHRGLTSLLLVASAAFPVAAQDQLERARIVHAQEGMIWAFMTPLAVITAICGFTYLCRSLIEHRRWLRATKIETDAQARILDRLSASEDLLTYLQSPAGQRFASVAPVVAASVRPTASPAARILWSVQTGIVLTLGGAGLWLGASRALDDIAEALRIVAIVIMAVGVGFALSAVVSLTLSRRLGLLEDTSHSAS